MTSPDKTSIKVAILDLYAGHPNQGMRCFQEILDRYRKDNQLDLSYQVFDVRGNNQFPGIDFDIYIGSGGPGSPLESEGSEWENNYFTLIDQIQKHNDSDHPQKKHVLFVCHSFQLMCRHYGLGTVNQRHSPSFGILPVHQTETGYQDPVFAGLPDPFYAVDSRSWQVIQPNYERLAELGATLLAIEKERPNVEYERCLMAIRFSEYFIGTQFHPEADPEGMRLRLLEPDKKEETIAEHGEHKYYEMLERLNDPDKLLLTQNTMIPNFLNQAILTFQEI
ncbi:type 1 glutamine amidotransferase [Mucilaginibacter arboris]|uniref:GMP synthase n=1 Tax=Mucilaginibacter arboris TaxID=2682090 RepID=A0A7K1SRS9_9SPHI|nr:GMP synthase [Mucilaginibacter arboris]MVN20013.1 GMP synthase [Mucilaginibacter arboris]